MSCNEESRKWTTLNRNVFCKGNEVFHQKYILLIESHHINDYRYKTLFK